MDRIQCFNVAASRVLQRLLESFPQPAVLDARHLQEEVAREHGECDIAGGPGNPGTLLAWTIQFLVEEGFVRTAEGPSRVLSRCTLTAKGFAALNRKLEALDPSPTIGARLLGLGSLVAPEVAGAIITRLLG